MKKISKILCVFLVICIASLSCIPAFASNGKGVNTIEFPNEAVNGVNLSENGENKIPFAENSKTDFVLVVPKNREGSILRAAGELRNALKSISNVEISIVNEGNLPNGKRPFYIGVEKADSGEIKSDGYKTVIDENKISILAENTNGIQNGVYAFIEEKLGCLFLTPDSTYTPESKSIYLSKCSEVSEPKTQWRDVYAYETVQNSWGEKLRLNGIQTDTGGNAGIEEMQYAQWGTWCHDCYDFLSPEDYFETHPEYFSEKNGKRVTEYEGRDAYLCLSNPEVYEIVEKSLAKMIEENPDKLYWDFSGNDNYALAGCECKECKKADKKAGGTGMGTLLPFLNKLAKAFPDKYISTLAYLHTLKAPKGITAEDNVVIKLCSMPGDQSYSYLGGGNGHSKEFKEQVEQWSKVAKNIVVWDYVVDFAHLLMPFPNFAVQAENQKFYEDNNVMGVFHQASREKGGELSCLRAYVLSHLMWEGSEFDVAECVSRYVNAYFGKAAPKVIEYLNLSAKELSDSEKSLGLYDGLMPHIKGYLSDENISKYEILINEAKKEVKNDELYLKRLEELELSVMYAKAINPKVGESKRQNALERLNTLCDEREITMVCEWDSLENFNNVSYNSLIQSENKELKKPLYIGLGVGGGVFLIAAASTVTAVIITKKKKK